MKLYHTPQGVIIESNGNFYPAAIGWDELINDDNALQTATALISGVTAGNESLINIVLPVIGSSQELWACGVTYLRSKIGRQEESKDAGGGDFMVKCMMPYARNVFLKVHHFV